MLFYMTTQVSERNEIVMSDLNNYESLYKVDLNFDAPGKVLCDSFYNFGYDDLKNLIDERRFKAA